MRILAANYRYFVSGGPERYLFNVSGGLAARGHEVIPFSIGYTNNQPTPYAADFAAPLGSPDEVTFAEQRRTTATLLRTLQRLFYTPDVERAVSRLAARTRPQVAYVLHYLRKLSPALLVGLKRAGVPIVVRLSDFGMLCPQAHCLRADVPCTLCVHGNLLPSVRYGCVHDSRAASAANALATWYHRRRRFFDLIDVFVTTTPLMRDMMLSAGYAAQRLRCIPTYVDAGAFRPRPGFAKEAYIVYAGALRQIKGVHVLMDAFGRLRRQRPDLNVRLKIAGRGEPEYTACLQAQVEREGVRGLVEFTGHLDVPQLSALLSGAMLSVLPSLWFENLPNALLESYACGTPVLASNLGSLQECVVEGSTGYRFAAGDPAALSERLAYCLDHPDILQSLARNARQMAVAVYGPERHLDALEQVFADVVH